MQTKKIWTTSDIGREGRANSPNTLANPQKVRKKSKSGNPNSSNDSLTGIKGTLEDETLQAATRLIHNGR